MRVTAETLRINPERSELKSFLSTFLKKSGRDFQGRQPLNKGLGTASPIEPLVGFSRAKPFNRGDNFIMYRIAVFDLDGTLANTLQDLANAVNYALTKNGFSPYLTDEYRQMVGSGINNLLKKASKSEDEQMIAVLKQEFEYYYAHHYTDTTVCYDGTAEMLSALQRNKVQIAVLSNKPDKFVSDILTYLYPEIHFVAMWGKKDGFPVKPDPQSFEALLKEVKADKQHTVYVGDSNVDVITAKNCGVDFIGCAWGFRGRAELIETGALPEKIADTLKDLENLILGECHE